MRPEIKEYNFDWMLWSTFNAGARLKDGTEKEYREVLKYVPYFSQILEALYGIGEPGKILLQTITRYMENIITARERGKKIAARTVIDIGGQDAKAIKVDDTGRVTRFVYNDKCASGTGRFLEIIADALEIKLEDMGDQASQSTKNITLSNQCVVFAENDGAEIPDIVNALHNAVANRAAALAKSITVENDVVMTGGVAKNRGMFQSLQKAMGAEMLTVNEPQINGAIGAAIMAREALAKRG